MVVYHFGVVGAGDIIFGIGGAKPSIDTRGSRGQQTYLDGVFIQAEFTFIPNQTKFQYGLGALFKYLILY
jgi:hypothetical protein